MSGHAITHKFKVYLLAAICLLIALVFGSLALSLSVRGANAQSGDSDMRTLLERLEQEISDSEREVFFEFVHPLIGDETQWTIPDIESEGGYIKHAISEIGEDYICFDERLGEIIMQRCTPFTNIASVSYISTP